MNSEEKAFIARTVGNPLIDAIAEVLKRNPADPIEFIAQYLYSYSEQHQPPPDFPGWTGTRYHTDKPTDNKYEVITSKSSFHSAEQKEDTEEENQSSPEHKSSYVSLYKQEIPDSIFVHREFCDGSGDLFDDDDIS